MMFRVSIRLDRGSCLAHSFPLKKKTKIHWLKAQQRNPHHQNERYWMVSQF